MIAAASSGGKTAAGFGGAETLHEEGNGPSVTACHLWKKEGKSDG